MKSNKGGSNVDNTHVHSWSISHTAVLWSESTQLNLFWPAGPVAHSVNTQSLSLQRWTAGSGWFAAPADVCMVVVFCLSCNYSRLQKCHWSKWMFTFSPFGFVLGTTEDWILCLHFLCLLSLNNSASNVKLIVFSWLLGYCFHADRLMRKGQGGGEVSAVEMKELVTKLSELKCHISSSL